MKKIYITTPIFYVNDLPHIGHAYTSIICDMLARFHRLNDFDVKFLTGTDEHGLKVEKAADKKKTAPQIFVDEISKNFVDLTKILKLSNTDFIRTTEARHKKSVSTFWKKLNDNNQIYLDKYEGWYSVKDETFFQEKELAESGGKFYTNDGEEVEWVKEESYFFKLSNWEDKLLEFYKNNSDFIKPLSRKNEVINFVKSGLNDLSISRTSFKWGIKVPDSNDHVIYVWIDALTNYLTSLDFPDFNQKQKEFWRESHHVIGKDILKFHAIYWPALLMAADLAPPKTVFAHGWWTNEGKKISKSLGNTVDPIKLISEFGLDQFKYFLLREVTLGQDGDFSEMSFITRINSDLSNNLGNLVSRTIKLNNKYFNNQFPINLSPNYSEFNLLNEGYRIFSILNEKIDNYEVNKSLELIWEFIDKLNQFIDKMEPWNTIKKDKTITAKTLSVIIESLRIVGIILQPFIPDSAEKILNMLNIDNNQRNFKCLNEKYILKKGHKLNDPEQLFPRYNV